METAGYQYTGKELVDVVLRPLFIGAIPKGVSVIYTEGSGSVKKTLFSNANSGGHNIVKYASGFQGGVASTKKQKIFELAEHKAENSYSKQDYLDLVQREAKDISTAFQNDIFKREYMNRFSPKFADWLGNLTPKIMLLTLAELQILQNGVDVGIFNNFWLGDKNKVTFASGTFPNDVGYSKYDDDIRFNQINGIWKNIFDNAATSPTIDQVKKINMDNSAVARVDTITVSGSMGTANIVIKATTYLATFRTDLPTTNTDFVALHGADLLLKDIIVTAATNDLLFTSSKLGLEFDAPTITNAVSDLAGSVAQTTGNTEAGNMAADEAMAKMLLMKKGQPAAMKQIDRGDMVYWATDTWIENYEDTLGVDGSDMATSESARKVTTDGIKQLMFNGTPVLKMPIDAAIEAFFGGYSPHRCILTTPANLALIQSSAGKFGEAKLWFNPDENENRTRVQLEMGADYFLPELIVAAFQETA